MPDSFNMAVNRVGDTTYISGTPSDNIDIMMRGPDGRIRSLHLNRGDDAGLLSFHTPGSGWKVWITPSKNWVMPALFTDEEVQRMLSIILSVGKGSTHTGEDE